MTITWKRKLSKAMKREHMYVVTDQQGRPIGKCKETEISSFQAKGYECYDSRTGYKMLPKEETPVETEVDKSASLNTDAPLAPEQRLLSNSQNTEAVKDLVQQGVLSEHP